MIYISFNIIIIKNSSKIIMIYLPYQFCWLSYLTRTIFYYHLQNNINKPNMTTVDTTEPISTQDNQEKNLEQQNTQASHLQNQAEGEKPQKDAENVQAAYNYVVNQEKILEEEHQKIEDEKVNLENQNQVNQQGQVNRSNEESEPVIVSEQISNQKALQIVENDNKVDENYQADYPQIVVQDPNNNENENKNKNENENKKQNQNENKNQNQSVEKVSLPLDESIEPVHVQNIQPETFPIIETIPTVPVVHQEQQVAPQQQKIQKPQISQPPLQTQPKIQQVPKVSPTKPQPPPIYTPRQRLDDANQLKTKGNTQFKNKEYRNALYYYFEGLKVLSLQVFQFASEQEVREGRNITFMLMLNIGQCHTNTGNHIQAVTCISQILKSEPNHFKALYRRANAYFMIQKYQQALHDIKQAYQIDQSNAQVIEIYNKVVIAFNQEKNQRKKQQKQVYKNMFNANKSQISGVNSDNSADPQRQQQQTSALSYLKYLLYGGIGIGASYLLTKKLNVTNDTEQIIEVAGSGVSASLLASRSHIAKLTGFIGLAAICGYLFSKK